MLAGGTAINGGRLSFFFLFPSGLCEERRSTSPCGIGASSALLQGRSRMGGQPKKVGVFSCFWHLREVWFDVALPLDAGRRALLRRWCPGSVQRHKVVFFCVFCEVLRCPLNVGWRLHRPCCGAGAGGVITGAGESSSRERS
jgi:hypothetical protein